MSPLSAGALDQKIEQNDEKHEDGHRRLRTDIRHLERRLDELEKIGSATNVRIIRLETTPVDVTKLKFTTNTVIAIVIAAATVIASQITSSRSMKDDLLTSQKSSNDSMKADLLKAIETQAESIREVKRKQDAQQYDINSLREEIVKLGGKR